MTEPINLNEMERAQAAAEEDAKLRKIMENTAPQADLLLPARVSEQEYMGDVATKADEPDMVNHPAHYGGKDNPYEVIKVLKAWGFYKNSPRFAAIKYLARADKKNARIQDLEKAIWYINEEIAAIKDGTL